MKLIAVVIILLSVVFVIGILVNKKKSAGVTAISQVFEAVSGPLHLDAGYAGPGDVKEVQHLLKDGVDVNVRDQHGRTLLMRAHSDNLEMIQTLLNAGVDVNAKDSLGNTALMLHLGNPQAVKILLQAGAEVTTKDKNGNNALMRASKEGLTETVQLLLEAKTPIETINKYGETALMLASSLTAQRILPSRAFYATDGGHLATVKVLLQAKAEVNSCDKLKRTPLMHAAQLIDIEQFEQFYLMRLSLVDKGDDMSQLIRLLLEHGADVTYKDKTGKTALDYALHSKENMPRANDLKEIDTLLDEIIKTLRTAQTKE